MLSNRKPLKASEDRSSACQAVLRTMAGLHWLRRCIIRKKKKVMRIIRVLSYYVSYHEVFKPGSISSPIRIVVNSSLQYIGRSLNDILMKGPNFLQNIYGVQLCFREQRYVSLYATWERCNYHSVHTTVVEKHLQRILLRNMEVDTTNNLRVRESYFWWQTDWCNMCCSYPTHSWHVLLSHRWRCRKMQQWKWNEMDTYGWCHNGAETKKRINEMEKNQSKVSSNQEIVLPKSKYWACSWRCLGPREWSICSDSESKRFQEAQGLETWTRYAIWRNTKSPNNEAHSKGAPWIGIANTCWSSPIIPLKINYCNLHKSGWWLGRDAEKTKITVYAGTRSYQECLWHYVAGFLIFQFFAFFRVFLGQFLANFPKFDLKRP